jgi:hypothetical protein
MSSILEELRKGCVAGVCMPRSLEEAREVLHSSRSDAEAHAPRQPDGPLADIELPRGRRARLAVRLVQWLASSWRSAVMARLAALVLLVRMLSIPWARWRQWGGQLSGGVRRLFYGGVLFLVFGPTCGAILVWGLVLLPAAIIIVIVVVVSLRAAAQYT